ncbi:uncharacterized protein FOMMEDRAFT_170324 [Fomitiporia mediterranea MF3/22]|uniref:uncharacterized protein n=1 Tax=Fomitiporia mediterranea (strain MF3/22) TaxID=694068 RepID=UPI00044078EB|nr:uncharacterized protein FOMMEDRAFT_170324 [Fomitiporia mediterranea MF3/22]EJC99731.1 hypothetical protein FOMMEDRAFT_170324 [Fomitiporia mediterranea MF3/22]
MYAASVNPPRRAKLQAITALPALLPSPNTSESPSPRLVASGCVTGPPSSVQVQQVRKKRGRKPASGNGPSSRAAREAARKANHSRIEKARRGKINNALEELKILVPPDFASAKEYDDEDGDCHEPSQASPTVGKKASKKQPVSEREFKLDILERTVLFVRSLLQRIDAAESQGDDGFAATSCTRCCCNEECKRDGVGRKRKHADEDETNRTCKKRQTTAVQDLSDADEELEQLSDIDEDGDEEDDEMKTVATSDEEDEITAEETGPAVLPRSPRHKHANIIQLPPISELISSVDNMSSRPRQLPSPSTSPYLPPHGNQTQRLEGIFEQKRGALLHPSPCFSPRQMSRRCSVNSEYGTLATTTQQIGQDRTAPCPVGMAYLLTPPSMDLSGRSTCTSAPALRLPSSALPFNVKSIVHHEMDGRTEGEEDGSARTATLALLQMRGAGPAISNMEVGAAKVVNDSTSEARARPSLTPGCILGIETEKRA